MHRVKKIFKTLRFYLYTIKLQQSINFTSFHHYFIKINSISSIIINFIYYPIYYPFDRISVQIRSEFVDDFRLKKSFCSRDRADPEKYIFSQKYRGWSFDRGPDLVLTKPLNFNHITFYLQNQIGFKPFLFPLVFRAPDVYVGCRWAFESRFALASYLVWLSIITLVTCLASYRE